MLALLAVSAGAHAADDGIEGVLRIGTPGDYAPYSWFDTSTSSYRGSDIALAQALAMRLGLRPLFVSTTWSTLVADARAGKFDIAVGGISITPERLQSVEFSEPYTSDRKQPVVRCGEEKRYDTTVEINRPLVRLIVNAGGTNERFSRQQFPAATLTVYPDNRTVFEEIRAGRADVMVTDAVEGRLQQRAGQGLCIAATRERWAPASKAVLVASGAVKKAEIDAALAESGGAHAFARALPAWEAYDWTFAQASARMATLIDDRLALVVEVARSKWNSKSAIEDPAREQQLLQSLRERALKAGVSGAEVDTFFRAQIEAAKVLQRELYARWNRQEHGSFAGVADLARDIRPEIDRITSAMFDELTLNRGSCSRMPTASTVSQLSPAAVKIARKGCK